MQARHPWRAVGALLVVSTLSPSPVHAQPTSSTPPLPFLSVDAYPPAAREDIGGAYRRALSSPDDAGLVGALGRVLHAWEQYDPAAQAYARAQHLVPDTVDWWYLGGLVADRRSHPGEAVAMFARALALAPDRPLVQIRLADARLAAGDVDGAAALYRRLVDTPECAPAAWYGLGRIYLMRRADDKARAAFEKALALFPAFGAAHYAMAQIHRRAGELAQARVSLAHQRQCLACWPMPPDPWRDEVASLRNDAAMLITRGLDHASGRTAAADAEAIRLHEAALQQDPTRTQAHLNLIELYGRTGNAVDAERHYLAAVRTPAYAAEAHRAYGFVLLSLQKPQDALAQFDQAATRQPDDPQVLQGRGLALEMLDRPAEAAEAYRRALRGAPTARDARFGLARTSMRMNQPEQAIAHLEHLREPVDAQTARYLFALSVAHVRNGDLAKGRSVAEQALDLARQFGDDATAAAIEAELHKLRRAP